MTAPTAPTFDLQSHSTASDGALAPGEVVRRAHAAGVELLALTDHDTVDGIPEALNAAADLDGIALVPAAEISALDGEREDLHICGYLLDHHDRDLLESLELWRADRRDRAHRMAEALRENGWALELPDSLKGDKPVGRPHLAQAVLDHPDNAARLRAEGLTNHAQILEAYLIPGTPGYRRRSVPTVREAIRVIHDAGGLAVWAHPFWDLDDPADVIETLTRFKALGLDGVEAFYVTHTPEQTQIAFDAAGRLGLLTTGSADFHGPGHPNFSAFRAFELNGLAPNLGPIAHP